MIDGARRTGVAAQAVLSIAAQTLKCHGDGVGDWRGRRVISCRAFPNKRGQLRLADENGFAAPVVRKTLFEVTAERIAAHVNRIFGFGQAEQIETCFATFSVSKAG